jgi:hypothetical protein
MLPAAKTLDAANEKSAPKPGPLNIPVIQDETVAGMIRNEAEPLKSIARINLERLRDNASRSSCQPVSAAPEFSQSMTSSMLLTAAYF